MRDYQRKKQTKYRLPQAVYHTTVWRIRDYYRIKQMADDLILASSDESGGGRSSFISDTVANTVFKREKYISEIESIDNVLEEIPAEYRKGVWNNIQFGQAYPLDAGRATYGRYKSEFIYKIAEKFNLI